jgi:hypothetical protein
MARNSTPPYSLIVLGIVFVALLISLPIAKAYLSPYTSGFTDMSCKAYEKACPEGYFCQETKCTSIFPK